MVCVFKSRAQNLLSVNGPGWIKHAHTMFELLVLRGIRTCCDPEEIPLLSKTAAEKLDRDADKSSAKATLSF